MSESIGVLYAPFQFSTISEPHSSTLTEMFKVHQQIVIALPVRRVTPTKNAPLDYAAREMMIRQYFGGISRYVHIVPVADRKYPKDKVAALESAVKSLFSNFSDACSLYTNPLFAKLYKENGGKWFVQGQGRYFEEAESLARRTIEDGSHIDTNFRKGVISGLQKQFPISWPTVDMAICRVVTVNREAPPHEKVMYLFGKKPGENGWRFPGGFKDRDDLNFETAVWREGGEEVLKKGVDPSKVFEKPHYISSRNVNDWRYKGEPDGITTLFYQLNFIGTDDQIKAGDDLCDAQWFCLEDMNPENIEGEHIYLYQDLCEYEKTHAEPMRCTVCNTVVTCDCGILPKGMVVKA